MSAKTSDSEFSLSRTEKITATVFMILGIIISLLVIIVNWPNKMPTANDTIYCYEPFKVTLIECQTKDNEQLKAAEDKLKTDQGKADKLGEAKIKAIKSGDSIAALGATKEKDSADILVRADMQLVKKINDNKTQADKKNCASQNLSQCYKTVQFGVLILILVAASGFLGNMVYVASSFTAFVGAEKFMRSWIMWYILKPFTASGLAVFLYMALNNITSNLPVNLNGILAVAGLTGLFTDIATLKLKEIFTAAFKPEDKRPHKLSNDKQIIDLENMRPEKIDLNEVNNFVIPGENLDSKNIIVRINDKKITPPAITVSPTLIKFSYEPDDDDKALTKFTLVITNNKDEEIVRKVIDVAKEI